MRRVVEIAPAARKPGEKLKIASLLPPGEDDLEVHIVSAAWAARDCVGADLLEHIEKAERGAADSARAGSALLDQGRDLMRGAIAMLSVLANENPKRADERLRTIGERVVAGTEACAANLRRALLFQSSLHEQDDARRQKAWRIVRRSQENTQADAHIWLTELAQSFPDACWIEEDRPLPNGLTRSEE